MMSSVHTHPLPLRLIVVEDHDLVREELVAFLQRSDWQVRGAEDGLVLDELLRQDPPDMVIIDLNLPGEDGLSICQRLRLAMPDIGIIMLTARILPKDKTAGYRSGADVYLTKPANVGELEAAIRNLARRLSPRAAALWQLSLSQTALYVAGRHIALSRLEVELLYALSLSPQRCLDNDTLIHKLQSLHHGPFDRSHLVVLISRLRTKISQALPPEAATHDLIKAIRGQGYQLTDNLVLQT